jgi:hypothetical protein
VIQAELQEAMHCGFFSLELAHGTPHPSRKEPS